MPRRLTKGGILADDMVGPDLLLSPSNTLMSLKKGLGKTLTTLALLRSNPTGAGILPPNQTEPLNKKFTDGTLISQLNASRCPQDH